jgi:PIN domain nuclease of toxin-antitoxin system
MSAGASAAATPAAPPEIPLCLDSSVVCTLLLQEQGWRAVHNLLQRPQVKAYLPGPVLTETITVVRRKGNASSVGQLYDALMALGLQVEHPVDVDLLRAAELIEISIDNPGPPAGYADSPSTLSLGDALILAVTERLGCKVLTRDTYWKWMVDEKLVDIGVVVP